MILKMYLDYPWRVGLGLLCLLSVDAAQLIIPLIIRQVVDSVAESSVSVSWVGLQGLLLACLAIGIALGKYSWRHLFFSASRLAEIALRKRIFRHALTLRTRHASSTSTGEIMALATNDVESVRRALAMGIVASVDATIYAVLAIGAIFWLDSQVALWVIIPLPILAILMKFSLKAVYERWDGVQTAFEHVTERSRESISGIRVIKAYGQQAADEKRFTELSQDYFERYMRYTKIDAMFHPAILLLTGTCTAILLGVGGRRVIAGEMSVGTFVAMTSYLGMLTWPMIAAGWMFALVQRASASMDRILTFMGKELEATSDSEEPLAPNEALIKIDSCTFTYPNANEPALPVLPALSDVSVQIDPGTSLGIVGEIGSGKSTLIELLMRLHEPPAQSIFIGGRDVRDLDLEKLRRSIAWVPQEAFLFSDTIENNLKIAKPNATREELTRVCQLAALDREIQEFSKGYQTLLGERGITLSGGQKQRLCLARALLKEAPILILDDTLSAVDADAESKIIQALTQVLNERTSIVISHRVSSVRLLDKILVLKSGRVIQSGTHKELLAKPGFYRNMAKLQELVS